MYEKIFEKYSPEKENLIYILHEIQDMLMFRLGGINQNIAVCLRAFLNLLF